MVAPMHSSEPTPPLPRFARFLAVGFGYAALNLALAPLQAFPEVALIYPPSVLGVIAGTLWPLEGSLGVAIATLATPWGPTPLPLLVLFAAGNGLEALIPGLALRWTPPSRRTVPNLVLWAVLVNTLANFLLARLVPRLVHLAAWRGGFLADLTWWLGDAVALAAFALPALLWLRPELAMHRLGRRDWRPLASVRPWIPAWGLTVAISAALYLSDVHELLSFNWPALLYLVPVGLMTAHAGLPGAVTCNAVVASAYLLTVAMESFVTPRAPILDPQRMLVVHANVLAFTAFALAAGSLRTRNAWLLGELEARWWALREAFEGLVRALAAAIEARDPATVAHVDRVAQRAERLAAKLGCPPEEIETVRWAAILHDVGKIGVPDRILFKPGPLTEEEREVMERHLDLGAQILERAGVLPEAIPLVRYHEERWDGATEGERAGRYGLAAEAIPLGARIIAVVDAFDAMTSDRPYRAAMTEEAAIEELRREAGRQFDPEVVAAFLELLREERAADGGSAGEDPGSPGPPDENPRGPRSV